MKRVRFGFLYILLVLLLSANVLAVIKRQWIGDWLALRNYAAPTAIVALADQNTMTDAARHYFFVNHPSLEDKAGFNQHCSSKTEHSVVLGCFHGDRRGIYLYDVQDVRLEGVKQVTAAHEMLHQAYVRLSTKERLRIDTLLVQFAEKGDFDDRIKEKIELYRSSEPDSLPNEMHSIFATEIRDLPSDLEAYYGTYFADRTQVVAFSDRYQGEFAARQAKVDSYDGQLRDIDERINHNKDSLADRQKDLTKRRAEVQSYLSSGNNSA